MIPEPDKMIWWLHEACANQGYDSSSIYWNYNIVYLTMPFPVQSRTHLVTSENSSCVCLA